MFKKIYGKIKNSRSIIDCLNHCELKLLYHFNKKDVSVSTEQSRHTIYTLELFWQHLSTDSVT